MPPHLVEPVPIVLDKPRTLKFTHEPLMEAERFLSKLWGYRVNMLTIFDSDDSNTAMGLNEALVLLWAALRHEDPSLTFETVCAITPLQQSLEVVEKVVDAWLAVYGQDKDVAPAEVVQEGQAPLSATIGANSGALAGTISD